MGGSETFDQNVGPYKFIWLDGEDFCLGVSDGNQTAETQDESRTPLLGAASVKKPALHSIGDLSQKEIEERKKYQQIQPTYIER